MNKIKIKFVGRDSYSREVFVTEKGSYVVDVNFNRHAPALYAKANNDFDGEPDFKVRAERFEIVEDF